MTLRSAVLLMLSTTVLALAGSLFIVYTSWSEIQRSTSRVSEMGQLHNEYYQARLSLEEAVLVERTPEAVASALDSLKALIDPTQTDLPLTPQVEELIEELIDSVEQIRINLADNQTANQQNAFTLLLDERQIRSIDDRFKRALLESDQQSEQRIQGLLSDALFELVITVAVFSLLALIIGVTVYMRTRGPLDMLMAGISNVDIDSLDRPHTIDLQSRDEFGRLAKAINSMNYRLFEQRDELLKVRERFGHLAETVDDLFWIFDVVHNTVVYLSPAFKNLYGFSPSLGKLNPEYWLTHIPEADHEIYRQYIDGWKTGESQGIYRFQRPDGLTIWVQDKAYAVYAADGTISRMVGVARDVTTVVNAQRALEQRARQQEVLYDVARAMTDSRDDIATICSALVMRLPELLDVDHKGAACIKLAGEQHASEGWDAVEDVLSFPIVIQGAEEGYVALGRQAIELAYANNNSSFLESERTSLEMIATHLSSLLHNRRIESRLWQDEKLKAVGELTGGVAHDFNNLLTVILGNTEMVLDDLDPKDTNRELLGMVLQASTHAADLTSRLLAFARLQPLNPETVELNSLIDELAPIIHRSLGETIEVNLKLEPNLWATRIDRSQLSAALLNLSINARDAMPEGGSLFIETKNQTVNEDETDELLDLAAGDYVVVAVTDDGCGIPDDVLEHVFEPFFTTKPKTSGTGLGLSMVYGFTKQSGGNVTIYSEQDQGTTVRLYLPRSVRAADEETQVKPSEFQATGLRALLVEDDPLVRSYTHRLLKNIGFKVMISDDADKAMQLLDQGQRFDLLLTDVVMPGSMDGIALGDVAREIDPDMLVLFMSGYTRDRFSKKKEMDPDAILLNKPFRRGELIEALQQVWSQRSAKSSQHPDDIDSNSTSEESE